MNETVPDLNTERGQRQRDARHLAHVATVSRTRAQGLARYGWKEGAPDRGSCVRTARLAHRAAARLREESHAEDRA